MSDAALGFLQGLSEGMAPGLEARARHKYAGDERIAAAAFTKAQDSIKKLKYEDV